MNSKGQIMITDLMLYIIILMMLVGMVLYTFNNINNNQVATISNQEVNQILTNTLDTLVKTEGTPDNWDKVNNNNIKTIGLRISNSSYKISYNKLIKLKNNNYLLDGFIPDGIGYSLDVYSEDNTQNILHIASKYRSANEKNTYSKRIPIIIDYGYDIYTINNKNNINNCPYNHNNESNSWSCKSFPINKTTLNNGTFYILTNANTNYELSNTYNEKIMGNTENITQINNQLNSLLQTDNDTIYIHIKSNDTSYLVYDANSEAEHLDSVYNDKVCSLVLTLYN